MTYKEFDAYCSGLRATTKVIQWGGSHVWKVGAKVFAIGGWDNEEPAFTFKVDVEVFDVLRDQPGLRPAPYLASRGMSWIQHFSKPGLTDEELMEFLNRSHDIVSRSLTKKKQRELGLLPLDSKI